MWRLFLVVSALAAGAAADRAQAPRWLDAPGAPSLARVWGHGAVFYGVGSAGVFRSSDGGATWSGVDTSAPAIGVWGSGPDDVWVVRARSLHHTTDGARWTATPLPGLAFGARLEGMWGIDRDRYVFGVDRSAGEPRGAILRSRDRGASWQAMELPIAVRRISAMWGRSVDEVYAVGAGGLVLRADGEGWKVVRPPRATQPALEAVWGTGANQVIAVGARGTIVVSTDRGTTWRPRASGVRYALTSLGGDASEILIGSRDGAPLRSLDGVTWRPLTAMLPKGDVWTSGPDHAILSASTGVRYLGEPARAAAPAPVQLVPGALLPDTLASARTQLAELAPYHHAAELLEDAVRELDRSSTIPAANPPGLAIRVGRVHQCSTTLDRTRARPTRPREAVVDLACAMRCGTGKVAVSARLPDGTSLETGFTPDRTWCTATEPVLPEALSEEIERAYERGLDRQLELARRRASSREMRADAYARYVLDGGRTSVHFFELARVLRRPVAWRGFIWNRGPTCRDRHTLAAAADRAVAAGDLASAREVYARVAHCDPLLAIEAVRLACRAGDRFDAQELLESTPQGYRERLVERCRRHGVELRGP